MKTTNELLTFVRAQLKADRQLAGIHVEVSVSGDTTFCVEHRLSLKDLSKSIVYYIDVPCLRQMDEWQQCSMVRWVAEAMAAKIRRAESEADNEANH